MRTPSQGGPKIPTHPSTFHGSADRTPLDSSGKEDCVRASPGTYCGSTAARQKQNLDGKPAAGDSQPKLGPDSPSPARQLPPPSRATSPPPKKPPSSPRPVTATSRTEL